MGGALQVQTSTSIHGTEPSRQNNPGAAHGLIPLAFFPAHATKHPQGVKEKT